MQERITTMQINLTEEMLNELERRGLAVRTTAGNLDPLFDHMKAHPELYDEAIDNDND
jgi:hypothetical protein